MARGRFRGSEPVLVRDEDVPFAGRLRGELEGDAGQLRGAVGALHEAQIGAGDAVGDEIAVLLCIEGLDNLAIGVGIGDVAHVHGLVEKVATRCLHFLDGIGADGKRDAAVGELVERITCHLVGKLFGCSVGQSVCEAALRLVEQEGALVVGAHDPACLRLEGLKGVQGSVLGRIIIDAEVGVAEGGGTLRMALTALSILLLDKKGEGIQLCLVADGSGIHAGDGTISDGHGIGSAIQSIALQRALGLAHPIGADGHLVDASVAVGIAVQARTDFADELCAGRVRVHAIDGARQGIAGVSHRDLGIARLLEQVDGAAHGFIGKGYLAHDALVAGCLHGRLLDGAVQAESGRGEQFAEVIVAALDVLGDRTSAIRPGNEGKRSIGLSPGAGRLPASPGALGSLLGRRFGACTSGEGAEHRVGERVIPVGVGDGGVGGGFHDLGAPGVDGLHQQVADNVLELLVGGSGSSIDFVVELVPSVVRGLRAGVGALVSDVVVAVGVACHGAVAVGNAGSTAGGLGHGAVGGCASPAVVGVLVVVARGEEASAVVAAGARGGEGRIGAVAGGDRLVKERVHDGVEAARCGVQHVVVEVRSLGNSVHPVLRGAEESAEPIRAYQIAGEPIGLLFAGHVDIEGFEAHIGVERVVLLGLAGEGGCEGGDAASLGEDIGNVRGDGRCLFADGELLRTRVEVGEHKALIGGMCGR